MGRCYAYCGRSSIGVSESTSSAGGDSEWRNTLNHPRCSYAIGTLGPPVPLEVPIVQELSRLVLP